MAGDGVDAMLERGREAGRAGRYEDARQLFAEARDADPDRADGYLGVAQASAYLGDHETALRSVAAAIGKDPRSLAAYGLLAQLALRTGRPALAQPALERAGVILTGSPEIFEWLARIYASTGDDVGLQGALGQLAALRETTPAEAAASLAKPGEIGPDAVARLRALAG